MTRWVFSGLVWPAAETGRVEVGVGAPEMLPGAFALPGLVDAHCHLSVTIDDDKPALGNTALALRRLGHLGRSGVTAVRDVGGERNVTLRLSAADVDGRPHVIAAGRFFAPSGRYYPGLHIAVEPADLVAEVVREIDAGAHWIKLIGDFPRVDGDGLITPDTTATTYVPDLVGEVVTAAHRRGARVAVHTNSAVVSALIDAGIDSVEHGVGLAAPDIEQLGARGGAWTPTLGAVVGGHSGGSGPRSSIQAARSSRFAELLPLAVRSGVHVLAGSDVVGSVVQEVALLAEHGLSVDDALRAASTGAQEFLDAGHGDDLVTYAHDPRDDPAVLARPSAVVIRGVRIV